MPEVACDLGVSMGTLGYDGEEVCGPRQLRDFARSAEDGKWSGCADFFRAYGCWQFPDSGLPGNWDAIFHLNGTLRGF